MERLFTEIIDLLAKNAWIGLFVVLFLVVLFRKQIWSLLILGGVVYGIIWVAGKLGYEYKVKEFFKKWNGKKIF